MALTVVKAPYRQERTPFWEKVGTELLIPALSDLWKEHRQTLKNRKENAMKGEFERLKKEFENMGQDSGNMGQSNGGFMNTPQMPEGYNSNGWANAFHNTDTPLTQFDMGTADILPPTSQSIQQAQQRKVATPADLRRIKNELAALKRFGNLSPDVIDNLFASDLKAAEEAYKQSQRDEAAQAYANAADALGKRDSAMEYAIRGITPESIAKMADDFYRYENPYYQGSVVNTGGQQRAIRFNPRTGEYTTGLTFDNTLTPQQVQAGIDADRNYRLRERELQQKGDQFNATLADTQEARRQAREDANRSRYNAPFAGADGKLYHQDQWGNVEPVMVGDEHMDAPKTPIQWGKEQEAQLEYHNNEIKRLEKDIENLQKEYDGTSDKETQDGLQTRIKAKKLEINSHRLELRNLFRKPQSAKHISLGEAIFSEYGKPTIAKGGHFGVDRGDHKHAGTDYGMPAGTPIAINGHMGDDNSTFKVTRVETDPNNPSHYGCMVDIEGVRKGKRVRYRLAHMQEGSVNVKVGDTIKIGDAIGKVGNTGRSSGNHLHLEIREWDGKRWVLQDPEKYIRDEPVDSEKKDNIDQAQPNAQGNAGQENAVFNNQPQQQQNNYTAVMNNPELNWTPNYQHVNMPAAYTAMNVPMIEPQQAQTEQNSTQANAQPNAGSDIASVLNEANNWDVNNYDLSNAEFTASLPNSGVVPRGATYRTPQADPDGGLTQYRAEGDNSPVAWRNSSGAPMRTSDGQLFTQQVYDDWARKADAGEYRDRKIYSRADLDKWLENVGMHRDTPAEQRGVNNLNGNSNANLPPENEDANIEPETSTPQNSPEKYPAPEFTDMLNGTTESDTQDLLNGLNGITDRRYANWTEALQRYYPNTLSRMSASSSPTFSNATPASTMQQTSPTVKEELAPPLSPDDYDLDYDLSDAELVAGRRGGVRKGAKPRRAAPQQVAAQQGIPQQAAPAPRKGRTSYEQQRTHVDNAAKTHGIDNELIRAVIQVESGWNPNARSKVGAMGLMQLMPGTARELGVKNAYDPAQNIAGGSKYLARLVKKYKGDVSKALMAYNCGPGNVNKGRIPKASKAYAKKVIGIYRALKGQS